MRRKPVKTKRTFDEHSLEFGNNGDKYKNLLLAQYNFFKGYRWRKKYEFKKWKYIVTIGSNINYLEKDIFNSIDLEYQSNLFEKMKGSDFVSDCVDPGKFSFYIAIFRRDESYIKSSCWWKND